MYYLPLGSVAGTLLGWLMGFLSVFLILLILIQRGKGGGLTGALGGPGGQSAFGSKAGDTFTVITVVVASIWAFTCAFTMWLLGTHAPTATITDTAVKPGPSETRQADPSNIPPIGGSPSGFDQGGIGAAASDSAATGDSAAGEDAAGEDAAGDDATEPAATGDATTETLELTPAESSNNGPSGADASEAPPIQGD